MAQTVTASLSNAPWRMEGELVFRSISATASAFTAWLTGVFQSQGTLATAGAGWGMAFGSTAAVTIDTTGTVTTASQNLGFRIVNFSVRQDTHASLFVAAGPSMQALN